MFLHNRIAGLEKVACPIELILYRDIDILILISGCQSNIIFILRHFQSVQNSAEYAISMRI